MDSIEAMLGELIIEGKTKQVFNHKKEPDNVVVWNKDRITAGDGARAHDMVGKSEISSKTNSLVFEILNKCGVPTAFVRQCAGHVFIAKKCNMIPIEWITRRHATGSYLKRHPGTKEGYRFCPPLHETCFKDDENHDPLWSDEQILGANFENIGQTEIDIMKKMSCLVFEILEKVWSSLNCTLVDMKVEYGFDVNGNILLADVIDSDSWRLWPEGKKELMKDKQVYRNLATVTASDLDVVKDNFRWVANQLESFQVKDDCLAVIIMGSKSDLEFSSKIAKVFEKFSMPAEMRIVSAHKETAETLKVVSNYEGLNKKLVFIAVAGKSNGLGPVIAGNTVYPVINCPPLDPSGKDIWSSLNMPAGMGCTTVTSPENAALAALNIFSHSNVIVWSKLRTEKFLVYKNLKQEDKKLLANM